MGLRPDAEEQLAALINPDTIVPVGISGRFWAVYLRGMWSSSEQGGLGVIVEQVTPARDVAFKIVPPAALQDLYNEQTLAEWGRQLADLVELLQAGRIESPYPNSLILEGPRRFNNYADMAEAVEDLYESVTAFGHGLAKQKKRGGIIAHSAPQPSPILAELALRMQRGMELVEDSNEWVIARFDHQLVASVTDCTPDTAIAAAQRLHQLQQNGEDLTVCVECENLAFAREETTKLLTRLESQGVAGIVAVDDADLIRQFEQLQRHR